MTEKPITEQPKSRCDVCNSTERTGYTNTETKSIEGIRDGKPYNRIVWRRCKCSSCGRHRVDKSFEFVSEQAARGQAKKEISEVRGNSLPAKQPGKTRAKPMPPKAEPAAKTESKKNQPRKNNRSAKTLG